MKPEGYANFQDKRINEKLNKILALLGGEKEGGHPGYRAVLTAALAMDEVDIVRLRKDLGFVVPKETL